MLHEKARSAPLTEIVEKDVRRNKRTSCDASTENAGMDKEERKECLT